MLYLPPSRILPFPYSNFYGWAEGIFYTEEKIFESLDPRIDNGSIYARQIQIT